MSRPLVWSFKTWPLHRQLVFTLVALLVVVITVIGAVSVTVQRHGLIARIDDQLAISLDLNWNDDTDWPQQRPQDNAREPLGPRFGSLFVIFEDGELEDAELVDNRGKLHKLQPDQISTIVASADISGEPSVVNLGASGTFRIAARAGQVDDDDDDDDDDEVKTVIVGQSLYEVSQTTRNLIIIYVLAGLVGVAGAALATRLLVRFGLRPLDRLRITAAHVRETPLASGQVSLSARIPAHEIQEGTEVGEVSAAFNQMLDHVERSLVAREYSEDRLRRFVADASHELRTPLAAVSGYAELASRHRSELPSGVNHSLSRISSEAARMTSMVQDLLLLARLDSGDSLELERVELARVVVDSCSDARVTGPDKTWILELAEDAADITVLGNSYRLHQALMNLLRNANLHTPSGTTVTVSLGLSNDSSAVIRIEDNGPGISPELQQRIYDRFARGDSARSRSAGSTGLGMSIVSAILSAHGGQIYLFSEPGKTVFTVCLPLLTGYQLMSQPTIGS